MCVRERALVRRAASISIDRRSPAQTIAAAPWRCWRRWRSANFWDGGSDQSLRDFPAVPAQRVHQLHGTFDEFSRLVDLFDRLSPIRPRNDDAVASAGAISADFVAQLLAVAIEKPNHRTPRIPQE